MPFDPVSPHYLRIRDEIAADVASGTPRADHKFPSEREMAERFGCTRVTLRQALQQLLGARNHELASGGAIEQTCQQLLTELAQLDAAVAHFSDLAEQPEAVRNSFADSSLSELAAVAARVEAGAGQLHAWCGWRYAKTTAQAAGLGALADAIECGEIAPEQALQALEVNYARWWLAEVVDEDDVLKRFVSAEHEQRIEAFRALDEEFTTATRQWIRAKLSANLPAADSVETLVSAADWLIVPLVSSVSACPAPIRVPLKARLPSPAFSVVSAPSHTVLA